MSFQALLVDCAAHAKIGLADKSLSAMFTQMFLVANVLRHGDGPSVRLLRLHAPELRDYEQMRCIDILPPNPLAVIVPQDV